MMAAALMLPLNTWAQQPEAGKFDWPYKVVNGTIKTDVPAMPAGQQTALGLVTPKMDVVRVAFVGLGMRGPGAVERWTHIPGIEIKALCDHVKERAEGCNGYLKKASMPPADIFASARTSTSSTSLPTGFITSLLPRRLWRVAST